ncbi:MAG: PilZ domain-containing protein [Deltaproteobacteria bacterium]|nr:PilZ domain-containing protein [Deltaproteobacteria bacterium]
MNGTDQREFRRYAVAVGAEVILDGVSVAAQTSNVSTGGVGLVLDRPVPEGGNVSLTLFLTQDGIEDPDEEPFEVVASVMWAGPRDDGSHSAGLQFANLSPAKALLLQRFLHATG